MLKTIKLLFIPTIIILFVHFYLNGFFYFKSIRVNNLIVEIPDDMIITSLEYNNKENFYFFLPFFTQSHFNLDKNDTLHFMATNNKSNSINHGLVLCKIKQESYNDFLKSVKYLEKKQVLKKTPLLKICDSYMYSKDGNYNYIVYHKKKHLYFNVSSNNKLNDTINRLCSKSRK